MEDINIAVYISVVIYTAIMCVVIKREDIMKGIHKNNIPNNAFWYCFIWGVVYIIIPFMGVYKAYKWLVRK